MNVLQMHRRLDKLKPSAGEFEHLTDDQLQQSIETLNKSILENIGSGDAFRGFEMLRNNCSTYLPDTIEAFITDNSIAPNAHLTAYAEAQEIPNHV